jgi:hypothetical protein
LENLKGRENLEKLGIDGRIILDVSGLELGPLVGSFKHGNEPFGSIKGGEFLDSVSDLASQEGFCSIELVGCL